MANIKITDKQWTDAKEYFEAGLSLSQINERTTIDKAAISRKAKAEGWIKGGEKQQLLLDAVRLEEAKSTLNQQALTIHNELVDERTKHILFFNNAAITNVKQAMAEPCENQNDFRARAETINKGREAVLGKAPDTAIQINNAPTQEVGHSTGFLQSVISEINAAK